MQRTTYRTDPWLLVEVLTAAPGVAVAVLMTVVATRAPEVVVSDALPPLLSVLALVAVAVGLVPAVCTPRPLLPPVPETAS